MWYLQYSDVNNLYGWALSQKLPVNKFEWVKDTSQLDEDFIKTIVRKKVMKVMKNWRKVDVYIEKLHELHNNLPFLTERMKI